MQLNFDCTQSINKLEAQMSYLINTINDRKDETLPTHFLTIPDSPSHVDRNLESWCLRDFNQDLISPRHLELDKYQYFDKLASFSFNKIELDCECEPDPQPFDLVSNFEYMLTPAFLPKLDPFLSQH